MKFYMGLKMVDVVTLLNDRMSRLNDRAQRLKMLSHRSVEQVTDYWREMGKRAYAAGKNTADCPSHLSVLARDAWIGGYAQAHDESRAGC